MAENWIFEKLTTGDDRVGNGEGLVGATVGGCDDAGPNAQGKDSPHPVQGRKRTIEEAGAAESDAVVNPKKRAKKKKKKTAEMFTCEICDLTIAGHLTSNSSTLQTFLQNKYV